MLTKPVQEIKPEELHEITLETYTDFKKQYIEQYRDKELIPVGGQTSSGTLGQYMDRLEYELKVIKEM